MDLAYERRGSGPPLVLLHGIGHRRQAWQPVIDRLAAERDVIAVDLPGFGESPPMPDGGPYTMERFVAALEEFWTGLGVREPHVVGNSLGGLLALTFACRGTASSVTALSPAGFFTRPEGAYTVAVLSLLRGSAKVTPPWLVERLVRTKAGRVGAYGLIYGKPTRLEPEAALDDMNALAGCPGFRATIAGLERARLWGAPKVPVTIGWGSRDLLLFPWQARRVRQWAPDARFVRLPGCGHVPMNDDPALVGQVVLSSTAVAEAEPYPQP